MNSSTVLKGSIISAAAVAAVFAFAGLTFAATGPAAAPSPCGVTGTPFLTYTQNVSNDPDSSAFNGGTWAMDTFTENVNVWVGTDGVTYCANANTTNGTFVTVGPTSPEAGASMASGIPGNFTGGENYTLPSNLTLNSSYSTTTVANVPLADNTCGGSSGSACLSGAFSNWVQDAFINADPSGSSYVNTYWLQYVTAGNGTWVDADNNAVGGSGGDTGDITGTLSLSTVYVDASSGSDTNTGSQSFPFKTIHAAANAVVAGGTVHVAAGSYGSETISADKVVTIDGAQAGVDARSGRPAASGESVVKLQVTAGDVTLDGFTFDAGGSGDALKGLYTALGTNNGLTVKNSVIENGDFGLDLPSDTLLPSFTADKNYFLNNTNAGGTANQLWAISPDTTTKIVTNNKFTGNDNADININWGDATVSGNQSVSDATLLVATETSHLSVTGNSGTFNGDGTAIFIGKGNHNVTISDNALSGAFRGVKFSKEFGGSNGGATTAAVISGNTIINPISSGIFIQNASYTGSITIDNNIIQGTPVPAVLFDTASGVTASGSEVMNNSFADATIGITWPDSGTLNGTKNYWNTGTTNPSSKTATSSSGDINVSPWYTNAAMTTLSDSTATDATVTSSTPGQADLPTGATDIVLTDTTVLDLSNATSSIGSTPVTIDGNTVTMTQEVTLQSGTNGDPIVLTNSNPNVAGVSASIPDGTTIQGPANWDGTIMPPTDAPSDGTAPAGFSVGSVVISIGSPDGTLVFNDPVTITLPGVTGTVGYRPAGSNTWIQITNTCGGSFTSPTAPTAPGECAISNSTDTKIVTFHFTSFGGLNSIPAPVVSSGGGGGGGGGIVGIFGQVSNGFGGFVTSGGSVAVALPNNGGAAPGTNTGSTGGSTGGGQVLGASTYNFATNLTIGSRGADVTALQQILISAGFSIPAGATGYFGAQTRAAVAAYQKAHGITPAVGYFGAITRASFNLGVTPTMSQEQRALLLQSLQAQLNALLLQIAQLKASGQI